MSMTGQRRYVADASAGGRSLAASPATTASTNAYLQNRDCGGRDGRGRCADASAVKIATAVTMSLR
eukprot:10651935-Karenia_brevis.AAC.1